MQVSLNRAKAGMLFIDGVYNFTFDEPGPVKIDVGKLTESQYFQLKNNIMKGLLIAADLGDFMTSGVPVTPISLGPVIDAAAPVVNRDKQLKQLLNGSIPAVKKNILDISLSDVRKLLEFEKKGKKRKSLITALAELLGQQAQSVKNAIGESNRKDININRPNSIIRGGLGLGQYLENIGDIVESDKTKIVIKTPDNE